MSKHRRRKSYDPDPRRKSHRGHRKGVEPAGLKRWRLAHRRTHDPSPRRHYFHRRRRTHDPAPPRRHFSRARRAGGKVGGFFNKWGIAIGALIGGAAGVAIGYNDYQKAYGPEAGKNYLNSIIGGEIKDSTGTSLGTRTPEISKLWGSNDVLWGAPRGPLDYLKYKFLGLEQGGAYKGSAWVYPFWIGLGLTLARPFARLFTHKGESILKPAQKVGIGMLGVSTAGALALPGCPKANERINGQPSLPPPPQNQNQTKIGGAF